MINITDPTRTVKLINRTVEDEIIQELEELDLTDSMNKFLLLTIYHIVTENSINNLHDINIQNVLYYTIVEIKIYLSDYKYLKIRRILQCKNKQVSFTATTDSSELNLVSTPYFTFRLKDDGFYTYQYKKCKVIHMDLKVYGASLEQMLVQFVLSEIKYIEFEGYKILPDFLLSLCSREELYLQEKYLKNRLNPENESLNDLEYHHKLGYVTSQEYSEAIKEIKKNRILKEIKDKESERAKVIYEEYMNSKQEHKRITNKTLCQKIKSYFKKEEEYNEFI